MKRDKRDGISNTDIAAFVEGTADRATARRVLAAALTDPRVRRRVELLKGLDASFAATTASATPATAAEPDFEARAERLRAAMLDAVQPVFDEAERLREHRRTLTALQAENRGGLLADVAAGTWTLLRETGRRAAAATAAGWERQWEQALRTGSHLLTLPCLAPATATAAAPELGVRRQSVTADGVRIEFQQLPGIPSRLRVLVDASALTAAVAARGVASDGWEAAPSGGETEDDLFGYNVAYLTLEDGGHARPQRHILVVSLNADGRGYMDYVVGGEGARALPAPRSACALIGATLSRWEQDDAEGLEADDFGTLDGQGGVGWAGGM